jgi:hypothetical protein
VGGSENWAGHEDTSSGLLSNVITLMIEAVSTPETSVNLCKTTVLKSRAVARNTKVRMYRTIIRPVVTYGSETWCLAANDERSLRTWEREVLRKICGPVYDNGVWRIGTKELLALYQELDIVAEIKKTRWRWLGHIERMSEDRVIKNCM